MTTRTDRDHPVFLPDHLLAVRRRLETASLPVLRMQMGCGHLERPLMKDNDYRRRNVRKAREAWMAMPPEQRKRRWVSKDTESDPEPPRRQGRPFGGDAVAYYHEYYAGLTRGQLHDQAPGLYAHCRRNRLLGHIPLKAKVSFPDPRAFYREHCGGMTRKQTALAEPQFYRYLQRHRLLDAIPFAAAAAAGGADRDARPQVLPPTRSPNGETAEPAEQRQLRPPSLSSARLGCFRIIPE
jgi:hypothetical protein